MQEMTYQQNSQPSAEQDEISLRELIEVLWQGKLIIVIITIVALLLGIAYSFFMTSDVYEATAVIMTTPIDLSPNGEEDLKVIDYLVQYPQMSTESYLYQIKAEPILLATIRELNLKNDDGTYWQVNQLANLVEAANVDKTNLITVKVRHGDAELATDIANEISRQFSVFISNNSRRQGMQTADMILEQLAAEELNMKEKSSALTSYLKEYGSIELLRNEVSLLVSRITDITAQLNSLNASIEADTASLASLLAAQSTDAQIDLGEYSVILDRTQSSDERIRQLQLNLDSGELTNAMLQLELVEVQTRLLGRLTTRDALIDQQDELNAKQQALQIRLNEEEYRYNALQREFDLSRSAFSAYQSMYQQALQTAAADIGATSIIIASEAIVPANPVAPNRILIVAIAAVLGVMIGVFVTFFVAYWKKSKPAAAVVAGGKA